SGGAPRRRRVVGCTLVWRNVLVWPAWRDPAWCDPSGLDRGHWRHHRARRKQLLERRCRNLRRDLRDRDEVLLGEIRRVLFAKHDEHGGEPIGLGVQRMGKNLIGQPVRAAVTRGVGQDRRAARLQELEHGRAYVIDGRVDREVGLVRAGAMSQGERALGSDDGAEGATEGTRRERERAPKHCRQGSVGIDIGDDEPRRRCGLRLARSTWRTGCARPSMAQNLHERCEESFHVLEPSVSSRCGQLAAYEADGTDQHAGCIANREYEDRLWLLGCSVRSGMLVLFTGEASQHQIEMHAKLWLLDAVADPKRAPL